MRYFTLQLVRKGGTVSEVVGGFDFRCNLWYTAFKDGFYVPVAMEGQAPIAELLIPESQLTPQSARKFLNRYNSFVSRGIEGHSPTEELLTSLAGEEEETDYAFSDIGADARREDDSQRNTPIQAQWIAPPISTTTQTVSPNATSGWYSLGTTDAGGWGTAVTR